MIDRTDGTASPADGRESYEAPRLTSVGNARDLLAGSSGSVQDVDCPLDPEATQPTGGGG